VASVALLAALAGTSVAAVTALAPKNSVGSPAVIDGSLQRQDFQPGLLPTAFASWDNGPLTISYGEGQPETLARLAIPTAGSYVISAKAFADGEIFAALKDLPGRVRCVLDAVGDVDYTLATLPPYGQPEPLAFEVVHTFPGPGTVTLQCGTTTEYVYLRWVKIVAIKVANLTNTQAVKPNR
jgi:hypothetical protein